MPRPIAIALALILAAPAGLRAHDIPNDVIVQAFLKPDGQRLQLLVRVPLEAMRDVDVPQRDKGYLDLARADDALRTAATVWIAREVALYEEDTLDRRSRADRRPCVASIGYVVQGIRDGSRASPRAEAASRHGSVLGAGRARCLARVPDHIRSVALCDQPWPANAGAAGHDCAAPDNAGRPRARIRAARRSGDRPARPPVAPGRGTLPAIGFRATS